MRRVIAALIPLLLLAGCGPRTAPDRPPQLDGSPQAAWAHGAYLLSRGDVAGARQDLEPLAARQTFVEVADPALMLRDLAEARLFSGEASGAASAAEQAKAQLALRPTTAQFRLDDRFVFERTLEALRFAATDDASDLAVMTEDEQRAPSADAWYLAGWLAEQHGNRSAAQNAYRGFLARAPQWAFLREAPIMRAHAEAFLR